MAVMLLQEGGEPLRPSREVTAPTRVRTVLLTAVWTTQLAQAGLEWGRDLWNREEIIFPSPFSGLWLIWDPMSQSGSGVGMEARLHRV